MIETIVKEFITKHGNVITAVAKQGSGAIAVWAFSELRTITRTNRRECYHIDDGKKRKEVTIEKVTLATKLRDKEFNGFEDDIYREIKKGGKR